MQVFRAWIKYFQYQKHGKSQSREQSNAFKYELRQKILDFSTFLELFGLQTSMYEYFLNVVLFVLKTSTIIKKVNLHAWFGDESIYIYCKYKLR